MLKFSPFESAQELFVIHVITKQACGVSNFWRKYQFHSCDL